MSSLTHGIGNGLARFPDELPALERLGPRELRPDRSRRSSATAIDCDLVLSGEMTVALEPHEEEWLAEEAQAAARASATTPCCSTREAVRAEVRSPLYRGGPVAAQRRGHPRSGEARVGAEARGARSWACGCTRARA